MYEQACEYIMIVSDLSMSINEAVDGYIRISLALVQFMHVFLLCFYLKLCLYFVDIGISRLFHLFSSMYYTMLLLPHYYLLQINDFLNVI